VTEYLDLEDLLAAAEASLGSPARIRDIGLLDAAAVRPRTVVFGEEAYVGLDRKAAALLHSIVTSHPLVDGNKRLGWVAVRLFYRLNETDVRAPANEAHDLVIGVAEGRLREVEVIAERLAGWRDSHGDA
jgi:death on curing protein